jgi:hypothetical protein
MARAAMKFGPVKNKEKDPRLRNVSAEKNRSYEIDAVH